jgi:thiamine kinase-like enzyme
MSVHAALEVWLKEKGRGVKRFEEIGRRGASSGRQALKVVLEDGSQIKARWLLNKDQAEAWHALRVKIGSRAFFSDFLYGEGQVVVEEWVEGEILPMANPKEETLEESAEILAGIHSIEIGAPKIRTTCSEIQQGESRIQSLLQRKAIPLSVAVALRDLLESKAPSETRHGLSHLDFCGENLVLHPSRGIVSIDHEWMCSSSQEFDLARAIGRWGLEGSGAGVFVTAYKRAGGCACTEALPWWLLANDIFAAEIRVQRGWTDASETLRRLSARVGQALT